MKIFKSILILAILLFCNEVRSGQGCLIGNQLYYNQTGQVTFFGLGARFLYDPGSFYIEFNGSCMDYGTYAQKSTQVTQGLFNTPVQCGFTGDAYTAAARGYVWNYDEIACPIDDHVWLLIVLVCIGTVGVLRKKKAVFLSSNSL